MASLMVIGLAHGYLLWYGDILFAYAVCGVLVFPLRRLAPQRLLALGLLLLLVPSLLWAWQGRQVAEMEPGAYAELRAYWQPGPEAIAAEEAAYRGGWAAQMRERAPTMSWMILSLPFESGWRVAGLMLIGMALLRLRVLSGERPRAFYRRALALGLALGLPLILLGVQRNFAHGWEAAYAIFFGTQYNYWGSLAVAFAYACAVILLVRGGRAPGLRRALAAVGRLAFSNYLLQTLICTTLFYGHGMGLFGRLTRSELLLVVSAVWLLLIGFSLRWLKHHRYGPMEWVWRTLSHGRRQPWYR